MQLHLMVDTLLGINLKFFIFSNIKFLQHNLQRSIVLRNKMNHQMRQVCQVFHQVSSVSILVVFTHESELRLKNLI